MSDSIPFKDSSTEGGGVVDALVPSLFADSVLEVQDRSSFPSEMREI